MYKLILFDLGGVVFTNGTKKFIADISSRHNIPPNKALDVLDGDIGTKYREGQISRNEFWKLVLESLQLKESADDLEKEWIGNYELISGTKEIISKLSNKYRVMYLSDNVRERVEKLNSRFGFISWFSGGIFSHEVGVRKPNPKIYEYALQKGDAQPEETVFIDDKQKMLEPATNMGIKTLLFETPEKLLLDLQNEGLL
jgi:putative hydrolase of the HAD superfamily